MEHMFFYNQIRKVPQEAQKQINAGRLKGMTDINPMWRIKTLTEQFGACGFGWYYTVDRTWIEEGTNGEKLANVEISLFVKVDEVWSAPIKGVGGSMLIVNESKGARTNDEAFKMALTDAISVSCKALGMGADVYWNGDRTKYTAPASAPAKANEPTPEQKKNLVAKCKLKGVEVKELLEAIGCNGKMTIEQYNKANAVLDGFKDNMGV